MDSELNVRMTYAEAALVADLLSQQEDSLLSSIGLRIREQLLGCLRFQQRFQEALLQVPEE